MSTPQEGEALRAAWRGSHRVRMGSGHRGLVVHGGFIPRACSHGGSLPPTLTLPSHLSRLRLQDRIRIIPLDVTLGTFHCGRDPGWVRHSAERREGFPTFIHTHAHAHGYLRPVLAEDRQVPLASWAYLTRGRTRHGVFLIF